MSRFSPIKAPTKVAVVVKSKMALLREAFQTLSSVCDTQTQGAPDNKRAHLEWLIEEVAAFSYIVALETD